MLRHAPPRTQECSIKLAHTLQGSGQPFAQLLREHGLQWIPIAVRARCLRLPNQGQHKGVARTMCGGGLSRNIRTRACMLPRCDARFEGEKVWHALSVGPVSA